MIARPSPSSATTKLPATLTSAGVAMWRLTTSDGRRVANIRSETDARRIVHTLGLTELRGPYSWDVVDSQGRRFVAEIKRRSGGRG
jgi:hypothetical protein